jgi:RNA polymerase sigma-70 factor (ECF subfamily)
VDAPDFEEFFREMHPRLVRYAKRRLEAETALDVASQTMQTIWSKNLDNPADDVAKRKLQSLAYRVVEGHIRNTLRANDRFRRLAATVADTQRTDPDHVEDIADLVVQPDGSSWLSQLKLTDREVLALLADGYAVAEIAVILDCSPAAISMRLQRARKNLKLILGRRSSDD